MKFFLVIAVSFVATFVGANTFAAHRKIASVWLCEVRGPTDLPYYSESPKVEIAQRNSLNNCSVIEGSMGGSWCRLIQCNRVAGHGSHGSSGPNQPSSGSFPGYCDSHPTAWICGNSGQAHCNSTPSDALCSTDYCSYHMADPECRP